jgi:hypothetical protein
METVLEMVCMERGLGGGWVQSAGSDDDQVDNSGDVLRATGQSS